LDSLDQLYNKCSSHNYFRRCSSLVVFTCLKFEFGH
jgi:hypothetical protein